MELIKWIGFMVLWMSVASEQEENANPDTQNYRYKYFVRDENTGDFKTHEEKKEGETVSGHYTVGEPTGDLRVVTYTADEGGFRANIKFEEGGSPLSDIRDKERQVNPTSGFQFEWLPANPDDVEQAVGKTSDEREDESKSSIETASEHPSTTSDESSSESNIIEENTPEIAGVSSSEESGGKPMLAITEAKIPESSEVSDSKSDSYDSTEAIKEDKGKEKDKKESEEKVHEGKDSESKEDSPEAAESAPQSQEVAPTEQNYAYLPPFQMQQTPYQPATPPQGKPGDRPTIIYASQNFYNPWQWFGATNRVQREEPTLQHMEEPQGHYMTGLGYLIVPPRSE